jgi:hypothetical protein
MKDTTMTHAISTNTLNNASKLSHNSIQGHYHSKFGIERFADSHMLRWAMTVGCLMDTNSPAARYGAGVLSRPINGCGMLLGGRKGNTLIISDMHMPYHHRDSLDFLWALHQEYAFERILNVGDIIDHHRGSYHESEPDAYDAETEYLLAKSAVQELEAMFPEMTITKGNHDILPERKLKTVGLPSSMLSDYNAIYGLKGGWTWTDQHKFDSWGAYPFLQPMVLNKRGRWDKDIMRIR